MTCEFVRAAKAGDESAWRVIYHHHYPWLYATALRLCGNSPAAKDAVQDTFLQAYLKLSQLKDANAFPGWLKTILGRICFQQQNRDKRYAPGDHRSDSELPDADFVANEHAYVHRALSQLSEALQSVLVLRYFTPYQSYETIASLLCVPVGTVRSRLNMARQKIMAQWSPDDDDDSYEEAERWNNTYLDYFNKVHHSSQVREQMIAHFRNDMTLMFTSGKVSQGKKHILSLINEDLQFGSHFGTVQVTSSGMISIVEVTNINSVEYPDHCPEHTVFVLYREKDKLRQMNLHNTPQRLNAELIA